MYKPHLQVLGCISQPYPFPFQQGTTQRLPRRLRSTSASNTTQAMPHSAQRDHTTVAPGNCKAMRLGGRDRPAKSPLFIEQTNLQTAENQPNSISVPPGGGRRCHKWPEIWPSAGWNATGQFGNSTLPIQTPAPADSPLFFSKCGLFVSTTCSGVYKTASAVAYRFYRPQTPATMCMGKTLSPHAFLSRDLWPSSSILSLHVYNMQSCLQLADCISCTDGAKRPAAIL